MHFLRGLLQEQYPPVFRYANRDLHAITDSATQSLTHTNTHVHLSFLRLATLPSNRCGGIGGNREPVAGVGIGIVEGGSAH